MIAWRPETFVTDSHVRRRPVPSMTDNPDDQLDGNISIYSKEILLLAIVHNVHYFFINQPSVHRICVIVISASTKAFVECTVYTLILVQPKN